MPATCNYFVSFAPFVVKRTTLIHVALAVAFAVAVLTSSRQANSATIDVTLSERVAATSPVIRLGDVARIVTADRQRARQLSALLLMPAPAPGTQRFLQKREVEDLLAAHGEDLSQLRIDGAAQVEITTPGISSGSAGGPVPETTFAKPMNRHAAILAGYTEGVNDSTTAVSKEHDLRDEVRRIISSYLDAKTGQTGAWRVTCEVPARHLAQLNASKSPPTCSGGSPPWSGRQQFILSFNTADRPVKFPVYADVTPAAVPVVVAVQPIARGALITAADVELQTIESVPSATSRRAPVTSLAQLIGMEARQPISVGDVVFTDRVQSPVLVKRGEVITVVSQGGGIRVSTTARARQDGARGELVQVESLETRERFDARVIGHRQAAVFASTSIPAADHEYSQRTIPIPPAQPGANQIETARR
jgi:flagella basal body P-ring formation protein FlgA